MGCQAFSAVYEQTQLQQPHQRALGGGRKAQLRTPQDKLFAILFYFKSYHAQALAFHKRFFVLFQGVAQWHRQVKRSLYQNQQHYAKTLLGRVRQ